ncbi:MULTISPECIES: type II secretion system protein GspM [unclassified Pseudomonas]|uniref:type II secretion system protein GspM n=1 Tax=unclassified Pseudomonas TaxID=196821 RepID=UPI002AC9E877|nr:MULTISPECIES: type II secretion system protein GspM [unclassified Pseudomonas]MEB0039937.1 type II secretion system protein GspM [Pseudomonas sp. MH10]MEB0078830.1 type II secretion system protein GspM [Pseudomonas sp. MH10out]MEB0089735.1 type II secretion system protein GspM [Pseudomonas sp. CCI4.2]MEB0102988.1 type II secretion system protein GspM [Pseudomonas sp. CCI3.2]MEB0121535.1 type II secretion system protein GspM [Pseudomonas sp. CCI1.2]
MNTEQWLARWQILSPREQWLAYGAGMALCAILYVMALGNSMATAAAKQTTEYQASEARGYEAVTALGKLRAALEADPNIPYNRALLLASTNSANLLAQIDHNTSELISPDKMRAVLRDLLKAQPGLQLLSMESSSAPVELPSTDPVAKAKAKTAPNVVVLYRHGVQLKLEGGYFDLLHYLQSIQGTEWKLNWDSLEYRVGDDGAAHAQISLELYTLSRYAGWVGV